VTISDVQLAILVGMVLQTIFFAHFFGTFKGRVETTLESHEARLRKLEPASAKPRQ